MHQHNAIIARTRTSSMRCAAGSPINVTPPAEFRWSRFLRARAAPSTKGTRRASAPACHAHRLQDTLCHPSPLKLRCSTTAPLSRCATRLRDCGTHAMTTMKDSGGWGSGGMDETQGGAGHEGTIRAGSRAQTLGVTVAIVERRRRRRGGTSRVRRGEGRRAGRPDWPTRRRRAPPVSGHSRQSLVLLLLPRREGALALFDRSDERVEHGHERAETALVQTRTNQLQQAVLFVQSGVHATELRSHSGKG